MADALSALGEARVDDLLPVVYADVTEAQLPVARFSLWAHLRYLAEEGRAEPLGGGGRVRTPSRPGGVGSGARLSSRR